MTTSSGVAVLESNNGLANTEQLVNGILLSIINGSPASITKLVYQGVFVAAVKSVKKPLLPASSPPNTVGFGPPVGSIAPAVNLEVLSAVPGGTVMAIL